FAWKPILDAVNEREEGIRNALASAEEARKEMQNLQADNERILKEARAQRETILKEARELKNTIIAEAKEEAKVQADKLVVQAQQSILAEKQAAVAEIKKQVSELSIQIAQKVVAKELSIKDNQAQLIDSLLKESNIN
ncbi:MAG: ATP synthase F0 subunit B, partial [Bacteroidetes bacterium HGW-Bacteroidetes-13]